MEDKRYLYDELLSISLITAEQLDGIGTMLEVQLMPEFKEDSWDCEMCHKVL